MAEVFPVPRDEWPAAHAVHEASFSPVAADYLSRDSFRAFATGKAALLLGLAEREGDAALFGYILLRLAGGEAEILSLGVLPEARNRGFGKKLVAAAAAAAKDKGAGKVSLEVSPANAAAIGAYRAAGFTAWGIRKGYYRHKTGEIEDALTMVLPLVN